MIRLLRKAALLIMVLFLITGAANCNNTETVESLVNWIYSWNEASSRAEEQNKPVMIDFYTDTCPDCDLLDSKTYTDEELSTFLNSNFICLKSNAGISDLYQSYNITRVPTIVFTTPEGTEIDRFVGYKPPDEFYQITQGVLSQWEA